MSHKERMEMVANIGFGVFLVGAALMEAAAFILAPKVRYSNNSKLQKLAVGMVWSGLVIGVISAITLFIAGGSDFGKKNAILMGIALVVAALVTWQIIRGPVDPYDDEFLDEDLA